MICCWNIWNTNTETNWLCIHMKSHTYISDIAEKHTWEKNILAHLKSQTHTLIEKKKKKDNRRG